MKKAIVLLSGGIDSLSCLAIAKEKGRDCLCLSFNYEQRHRIELESAKKIAEHYHCTQKFIHLDPELFQGSSLVNQDKLPPKKTKEEIAKAGIPSTYVPARNTLFLSYALAFAESYDADEIYFGANALDLHGYPDCRPPFIAAFQALTNLACKKTSEGGQIRIETPLIELDKLQIVALAKKLQAPLELSFTCYDPLEGRPCQQCDACVLRNEALK